MNKLIASIILSLVFVQAIVAQQTIPTIRSTKQEVLLKFNNDSIVWYIEPHKNPDIFYIGSTLKAKQVWFITDVDSLYFNIEAGKKYDFIVRYNNQNCNSRIQALENPVLLNRYLGFSIVGLVLLVFVLSFYKAISNPSNQLIQFGIITPVLFWVFTIIAGLIHGNYNHFSNAVSNLGEIGTNSEIIMAIFTLGLAISCLLFSVGFYKASKEDQQNLLPAILSFAMPVSFLWAAIFPAGHELHGSLGPLPALIILGALLLSVLWKNTRQSINIRIWSAAAALVMLLFVVRFISAMQQNFEGLIQRTLYAGWSIWLIAISIYFKKGKAS